MRAFLAMVVMGPFIISGCISSTKKYEMVEGQDIWSQPQVGASGQRTPTAQIDFIKEIEDTQGGRVGSLVAGDEIADAKAKMEKIFEFARKSPQRLFAQLRAERPIFSLTGASGRVLRKDVNIPNIVLVTRYADVQEILDNYSTFSVKPYATIMDATVGSPYMLGRENSSANEEKPTMRHALHGKNDQERVRTIVKSLAQRAIQEGAKNGQIDVVKSVTRSVPLGINEEYFGFNGPSREASARWSRATQHAFFHNPFREEKVNKASIQAGVEMRNFIASVLVPQRKQELKNGRPANDTVSQILNASHMHGQFGLSDERIVANIIGLLVGSVETTSAAIAQSLQFLMNNPGILAEAQKAARSGNDERLSKIVWEALRFDPVNPWLGRYAEQDYVIARGTERETLIPKGSLVLASTESAMWDEAVFPQSSSFIINRDQSKFMHLGYGYHRCLGDDVSLVMVPETIKQILLLDGLRKPRPDTAIDQDKGPFPESYVLAFNQESLAVRSKTIQESVRSAAKGLELELLIGGKLRDTRVRREAIAALRQAAKEDVAMSRQGLDRLSDLVASASQDMSETEKVYACSETNPKSKEIFPNPQDRTNYCQVNMAYRACYFVQRLIGKQTSYTAYYYCAYGREHLNSRERETLKTQLGHLDMFYFLNTEESPK